MKQAYTMYWWGLWFYLSVSACLLTRPPLIQIVLSLSGSWLGYFWEKQLIDYRKSKKCIPEDYEE